jgi:uncharacterized protein (TIGR03083 family)
MSARELLREHDRLFVAFTRTLAPSEWDRPSLCSEWSTHDVLAHLVIGYSIPLHSLASSILQHRGSFDRANAQVAQRLASRQTPQELIDTFERCIARPQGIGKLFPPRLLLGDHVLHHLDIALALGRQTVIPDNIMDAVLETEVRIPNPFVPARRNAAGLTLRATDTGWTLIRGDGARHAVQGSAIHLATALAGRTHALASLAGDGVVQLDNRITRHLGAPVKKTAPDCP